MAKTRIPTQQRSIEKKEKIITKGFELMCEKGFFNVTTPDIAKFSGVSTGIIYQYFKDKKEIFIVGTKKYANEIMFPIYSLIDEKSILPNDLTAFFKDLIKINKEKHTIDKKAHQEISAMQHLDEDIEQIFKDSEIAFASKLELLLKNNGYREENLKEKTHLIVNLIDNFAHEEAYHKHDNLDYELMENLVVKTILNILAF